MPFLRRLLGRYRLWWGFCPACNSDAPAVDTCPVCQDYRGVYPPPGHVRAAWWERFAGLAP